MKLHFLLRIKEFVPQTPKFAKPPKSYTRCFLRLSSFPKCHQPFSRHLWFQSYGQKFRSRHFQSLPPRGRGLLEITERETPVYREQLSGADHFNLIYFQIESNPFWKRP